MIGSHDSYTFLSPRHSKFKWVSFLWRTQTKNIEEQLQAGVEYLDIRVYRDVDKWRVCHGKVDFDLTFLTLEDILRCFPLLKIRIILEHGTRQDESLFEQEVNLYTNYVNLSFACIKKDWRIIINRDPEIIDYSFVPFMSDKTFWENIKRMKWLNTIKHYAKKHRPEITDDLINDTKVHFLDYV